MVFVMVNSNPRQPPNVTPQDAMASLKLYVDLANSERQAIWTRHATMLVANSLIVTAARSDAARSGSGDALFLNGAGLALCIVWFIMIWNGYTWFYKSMEDGKSLPVDPSLNPFAGIPDISVRWKDVLFLCAVAVSVIFAAVYAHGLWPAIKSLVCR